MNIKPPGWVPSFIIFLITASLLRVTLYYFPPAYTLATGKPYLIGYLIGWVSSMFLIFIASLVAFKIDGHPTNKKDFISRYRLEKLERVDWVWTLAMIVSQLCPFPPFHSRQRC